MSADLVLYEKQGPIAIVTLNRPERMNAVDTVMRDRLADIWADFGQDRDLRVAIMTGAGDRAFCGGMDVKEAAGASVAQLWQPKEEKAAPIWKPIISAVNGVCAGIGLGLLIDSDIALCSENATFIDPHVSLGQVAAVQAIALSRRIPLQAVMRMALMGTSERLTAQQALSYGLVSEVTTSTELMPRAMEIARRIAANSPSAVAASKQAILEGLDLSYSEAIENGMRILQRQWDHPDHLEGPRSFAEKRPPKWMSE